jgi:hypothetical protein
MAVTVPSNMIFPVLASPGAQEVTIEWSVYTLLEEHTQLFSRGKEHPNAG